MRIKKSIYLKCYQHSRECGMNTSAESFQEKFEFTLYCWTFDPFIRHGTELDCTARIRTKRNPKNAENELHRAAIIWIGSTENICSQEGYRSTLLRRLSKFLCRPCRGLLCSSRDARMCLVTSGYNTIFDAGCNWGYLKVEVQQEFRDKTAFRSHHILLSFILMHFGMKMLLGDSNA